MYTNRKKWRKWEGERIRDDITMDTKSTFECAGISSEKSLEAENGLSALLHYSFACLQLFMRFSPIQDSISFCHLKIYGFTSKISIVLVKTKTRNIMIYYHLIHFYNLHVYGVEDSSVISNYSSIYRKSFFNVVFNLKFAFNYINGLEMTSFVNLKFW